MEGNDGGDGWAARWGDRKNAHPLVWWRDCRAPERLCDGVMMRVSHCEDTREYKA